MGRAIVFPISNEGEDIAIEPVVVRVVSISTVLARIPQRGACRRCVGQKQIDVIRPDLRCDHTGFDANFHICRKWRAAPDRAYTALIRHGLIAGDFRIGFLIQSIIRNPSRLAALGPVVIERIKSICVDFIHRGKTTLLGRLLFFVVITEAPKVGIAHAITHALAFENLLHGFIGNTGILQLRNIREVVGQRSDGR